MASVVPGGAKFFLEAVKSKRRPRDNVCEGVTATCGPPGHPCETCMHLKGFSGRRGGPALKDMCLIAPRSLMRPVKYKKYFNRGTTVPPYLPVSKVKGELKEVALPRACELEDIEASVRRHHEEEKFGKFKDPDDSSTPYLISHNVYLEHHGKFTKAPKHLLQLGDYSTRTVFLEDSTGPDFSTALDCAIFVQRAWAYFAKVAFGILAGVALIDLILIVNLVGMTLHKDLRFLLNTYAIICPFIFNTTSVLVLISLVALFDWIDLEHLNTQHVWDTYLHRSIWIVILPYIVAFLLSKCNAGMNDELYLHGANWTSFRIDQREKDYQDYGSSFSMRLASWQLRTLGQNIMLIIGWSLLVLTRNDDLFMLHLQCLKKYDLNPGQMGSVNDARIQALYHPRC